MLLHLLFIRPQVRKARCCIRFLVFFLKLLNNSWIYNLTTLITCSVFTAVSWLTVLLAQQYSISPLTFRHTLEMFTCYLMMYVTRTGGASISIHSMLRMPVFSYKIIKLCKILNMGGNSKQTNDKSCLL